MKTQASIILQELNSKYGVSDEKIAGKFSVRAITVYRWRVGKCNPSAVELKLLQRILRGYQN